MRIGMRVRCLAGGHAGRRGRVVRDDVLCSIPSFAAVEFDGDWFAVRMPKHHLELDNAVDALASIVREGEHGSRADAGPDQA